MDEQAVFERWDSILMFFAWWHVISATKFARNIITSKWLCKWLKLYL